MGILGTILIGLVVGLLARWLHPGHDRLGLLMTALLGIAGSVLATIAGQALGLVRMGHPAGFLGAVIGAVVILAVYSRIKR